MESNSFLELKEVRAALHREAKEAVDELLAGVEQGLMIEKDGRAHVMICLEPWLVRLIRVFSAADMKLKEQDGKVHRHRYEFE